MFQVTQMAVQMAYWVEGWDMQERGGGGKGGNKNNLIAY